MNILRLSIDLLKQMAHHPLRVQTHVRVHIIRYCRLLRRLPAPATVLLGGQSIKIQRLIQL